MIVLLTQSDLSDEVVKAGKLLGELSALYYEDNKSDAQIKLCQIYDFITVWLRGAFKKFPDI